MKNPSSKQNLTDSLPDNLPHELVEKLLEASNVRVERIVSHGHASPLGFWYDQDQSEWVLLLRGAARLGFENQVVDMKPGDYLNIGAHCRHRVEWTTPIEPTIWLVIFHG